MRSSWLGFMRKCDDMTQTNKQQEWDKRIMKVTLDVASWSSCLRRKIGAVITNGHRIIATGYNGAPSGVLSCVERNECLRNKLDIPSGTQHERCYATHAEQNAICQAARIGISVDGCTLYCTQSPCSVCTRVIINSGIKRIVYLEKYPDDFAFKLLNEANIELVQLNVE